jgi:hypothetical protein
MRIITNLDNKTWKNFLLARLISEVFASPLNNQTTPNPLKITMQCMRGEI